MTKRTFRWRHDKPPVEVPTVAAFMDAYEELCRKHGMRFDAQFESPEFDGYGSMRVSIVEFDDSIGELEINELDSIADIPEASEILERQRAAAQAEEDAAKRKRAEEITEAAPDDPVKAIEMALGALLGFDERGLRAQAALKKALKKLKGQKP